MQPLWSSASLTSFDVPLTVGAIAAIVALLVLLPVANASANDHGGGYHLTT